MADYTQLAADVVKAVGGKENIIDVTNCMTRLRFVLKDDTIPNKDTVMAVEGVKGVMNQGGQYQVIIGTHVNEVIKDVRKVAGLGEGGIDKESIKLVKKDSLWNRFFKTISGCIMPMLGPMIAGDIIKGMEVLIHVGVDTVKMNGKGFHTLVSEGDMVKAGDELIRFDIDEIKKAGFSPITVLVTNSDDYDALQVRETSGSRLEELISLR